MSDQYPTQQHPSPRTTSRPRRSRRPQPRRRRTGLAAAVVATSLLVGGGAGLGGAAVWDATHDEPVSSARADAPTTSTVANQTQTPPADGSVESVAQKVLPSVVKIDVTGNGEAGSGSGIILTADGTILTNNHVVEVAGDGGTIKVSFADGTSADAEILGTDPLTDTAVIQAAGGLRPHPGDDRQVRQPGRRRGRGRDRLARSASTPPSPAASSARSTARSTSAPTTPATPRRTPRSRPTRRSTPATPAVR